MIDRRIRVPIIVVAGLFFVGCGSSSGSGARGGSGGGGSGGASSGGTTGGAGAGGAAGHAGASGIAGGGAGASAGAGATAGAGGSGGVGTSGASGGGTGGSVVAPVPFTVNSPLFVLDPGAESTQCVVLDVGNSQPIYIGGIQATRYAFVYELRIGATSGPAQTTPAPCTPYGDIDDASVKPLLIARNFVEEVQFPSGVGYTFAPHQMLRFEMHGWNPSTSTVGAQVSATFTPVAPSTFQQEAGLLLLEAADINVPAGATVTLGPTFFPVSATLGSASISRLMGYTHPAGVLVSMATATGATDSTPMTIYSPTWNPDAPPVVNLSPAATVPSLGGIDLTCAWHNVGATTLTRGPSVNDERCAAVVSYYPAVTAHRCLHTGSGGGVTVCCPGNAGCP